MCLESSTDPLELDVHSCRTHFQKARTPSRRPKLKDPASTEDPDEVTHQDPYYQVLKIIKQVCHRRVRVEMTGWHLSMSGPNE